MEISSFMKIKENQNYKIYLLINKLSGNLIGKKYLDINMNEFQLNNNLMIYIIDILDEN